MQTMNINLQSVHFTANQELIDFVTEKISSLSHYYDKIESAKICLKLDKSSTADNKVCEVRLAVPGNDLFAKKQCKSFEEATIEVVDALQEQIRKLKIKLNSSTNE